MKRQVYRYRFTEGIPLKEVEDSLFLAILAVEGLHGQAKVRLNAHFLMSEEKRTCVIDVGSEVGLHIALIFLCFLNREFGEDAFTVEQAKPRAEANAEREPAEAVR